MIRTFSAIVVCAIALLASRSTVAQQATPVAPHVPISASDEGKPPLNGGVISAPPPFAVAPPRFEREFESPDSLSASSIALWYGVSPRLGHQGDPQKWVNLLGRVNPVSPKLLTYSVNGGPHRTLNVGPDKRRLAQAGDFNIQLDYTDLLPGNNQVVIRLTDSNDIVTETVVTVNYQGRGSSWTPGTYIYDWSTATHIEDLAQVVDGQWVLDGNAIRPTVFAYDRLVTLGDLSWRDYTVTVPITFYGIDPKGYDGFSAGPGIGLLVRWPGHYYEASNGADPYAGWRRLGALAWYRWKRKDGVYTEGMQIVPNTGGPLTSKDRKLTFGTPYVFKLSIQSQSDPNLPATYRFKVWEQGQPEPSSWDIVKNGTSGEPAGGGLLLVAHHVDATFGAVTVELHSVRPQPMLTFNTGDTGTGTVTAVPAGPFRFGEDVLVTALPHAGSAFVGWSGSLTGSANPLALEMFGDHSITALFSSIMATPTPVYLSPTGTGSLSGMAFTGADILSYDKSTNTWDVFYDGSAAGTLKNVSAFAFTGSDLILGFSAAQTITGPGAVAPQDLVRFTPTRTGYNNTAGTFTRHFDGSEVGLTTAGEIIDALWIDTQGRLYISTAGSGSVPVNSAIPSGATITFQDEDILRFTPSQLGATTAGVWELYWNPTAMPGMSAEDINGYWVDPVTGDRYVTILGAFSVGAAAYGKQTGNGKTILRFAPNAAAPGGWAPVEKVTWLATGASFSSNIDEIVMKR